MIRVRRWLFNGAVAVSLGLLLGVLLLWISSYHKRFSVEHIYETQPDGKTLAEDTILPYVTGFIRYDYYAYSTTGRLVAIRWKHVFRPQSQYPEDSLLPRLQGGYWTDAPPSVASVDYNIRLRGGSTRFGFGFANKNSVYVSGTQLEQALMLPDWFVVLLFAILPAIWFYRWRRSRRRFAAHLCQTCGYDLRATPERCPECGTISMKVTPNVAAPE